MRIAYRHWCGRLPETGDETIKHEKRVDVNGKESSPRTVPQNPQYVCGFGAVLLGYVLYTHNNTWSTGIPYLTAFKANFGSH